MTRIIVHAGFHKTGTTSLQAFVEANRTALKPWADIYLKTDLSRARYLGRWYGQRPIFWRLWLFRHGFRRFLSNLPDAATIFISRESFSGMMPGFTRRNGTQVTTYADQAIPLAREIVTGLRRRFGPTCQIEFLYTTRQGQPWLKSIYAHIVRTSSLREDFTTFQNRFGAPPDLDHQATLIATAIAPVPVHVAALEDVSGHRLGHGRTVLGLLNVPRRDWPRFPDASHNNPGQSDALTAKFLEMNRREHRGPELKAAKKAMLTAERNAR
jgi:hypothetical protein